MIRRTVTPVTAFAAGLRNLRRGTATPDQLRAAMNFYPPLAFAGVRIDAIADDWSSVDVHLKHLPLNRNFMGTQYGGSLYTMTDPWWALLLIHRLGPGYDVWDRKAAITYVAPGRTRVFARFEITDDDAAEVRAAAEGGEKVTPWYETQLTDRNGDVVATVAKQIYVRRRRPAS